MSERTRVLLAMLICVPATSCWTRSSATDAREATAFARANAGTIRGRVTVASTGRPARYALVVAGGDCVVHVDAPVRTETDADGRYELEVSEGLCGVSVTYRAAQVVNAGLRVRRDQVIESDFVLDTVSYAPPISRTCPGSGTTPRHGSGASPGDATAIAAAVLERFATYRNYLTGCMDHDGPVGVLMELERPNVQLGTEVLPAGAAGVLAPRDREHVRRDMERSLKDRSPTVIFSSLDSDGRCALVTVGCRTGYDTDLYEKKGSAWRFVRRVGGFWIH